VVYKLNHVTRAYSDAETTTPPKQEFNLGYVVFGGAGSNLENTTTWQAGI